MESPLPPDDVTNKKQLDRFLQSVHHVLKDVIDRHNYNRNKVNDMLKIEAERRGALASARLLVWVVGGVLSVALTGVGVVVYDSYRDDVAEQVKLRDKYDDLYEKYQTLNKANDMVLMELKQYKGDAEISAAALDRMKHEVEKLTDALIRRGAQ